MPAPAEAVARWTLSRAGILNVYQYGDETLHFAGGRLLLRGVNGSGKSTAMNMLLPFLIDADTRRIDAAGEQTGVLRSWMLSGRAEQQPVGYLWIELARGDEHLVCGCGIRANRSTDTVNVWWFVTPRRPGIDFHLVEGRVPLGVDGLRAVLDEGIVFTREQRQAYRAEVRARLFGGADLDQHISLLHVVRSPRVGDRIDADLPAYLDDALPQLSDAAIEDAAQPLEDLEEHRRNVAALTQTAQALDALVAVYRSYARTELHTRAQHAREAVAEVERRRREELRARRTWREATRALETARAEVRRLEAEDSRLSSEIEARRELPQYREGQQLEDLRRLVRSLERALAVADDRLRDGVERAGEARVALDHAAALFDADAGALAEHLRDLAVVVATAGVPATPPDLPAITVVEVDGVKGPAAPLDPTVTTGCLDAVNAGVRGRRGDVEEVRGALARVERAERTLRDAEQRAERTREDQVRAEAVVVARTEELHHRLAELEAGLRAWTARAAATLDQAEAPVVLPDLPQDLLAERTTVRRVLLGAVRRAEEGVVARRAAAEVRRRGEQQAVADLEVELAELLARSLPEPPRAPWQEPTGRPTLAELVDFRDHVDDSARRGLEAALEAAGLLGAEVADDGLHLRSGDLVVVPAAPVPTPLGELLRADVPDELDAVVTAAQVDAVLNAISTDPDGDATVVVSADGRFRAGTLHGRHQREVVEHVGSGARAAALERHRAEVRRTLDDARSALAQSEQDVVALGNHLQDLAALVDALPATDPVDRAVAALDVAEDDADARRRRVEDAAREVEQLERAHAEADDDARRLATTRRLPALAAGLADVEHDLQEANRSGLAAAASLEALRRTTSAWTDAATRCRLCDADVARARTECRRHADELEPQATKLAALEQTLGEDYERILAEIDGLDRERTAVGAALGTARAAVEPAVHAEARAAAAVTTATDHAEEAERRCVGLLPDLHAAAAVPGLWAAAVAVAAAPADPADEQAGATESTGATSLGDGTAQVAPPPTVESSSAGLRVLAEHLRSIIPPPDTATAADSVRQSLRSRRDTLGAGWDAEDRQPHEHLPLLVEVNGPEGRLPLAEAADVVRVRLRHQAGLLTAKQDQALRNLLQGLIAREVATKLHAARELVSLMNDRLRTVSTTHGIGVSLRWRRRDDLDDDLARTVELLGRQPDLRSEEDDAVLAADLSTRIDEARRAAPEAPYRQLIGEVLDYRRWHLMSVLLHRPGRTPERLSRRTALSEGEKKMVSYLPLFAAVAASYDALAEGAPGTPRFVLLDDAFAKVSEDNHAKLFGLLVELDLDFIATSERLWGTHATVPELAITEVVRDADAGVIVLEHARWDGATVVRP